MKTLEEAVVQLEHEPDRTVIAEINGLVVELRCRSGQTVDRVSTERPPERSLSQLRGFLKGMKTEGYREKKDRI